MKKIITSITTGLICITIAYSQDTLTVYQTFALKSQNDYTRHKILIYLGTGYANSIYDRINNSFIYSDYSYSSSMELKYAYFFAPEWGVSSGAGLSRFMAQGTFNMEGVIPHYRDPQFDPSGQHFYDLYYKTDNLVEQQQIWALEIPLQFHFESRIGKNGIFASLGAKGYFPVISAQSKFPQGKGSLTTMGYEAFTNTWYVDPPHFGKRDARTVPATVKLNCSVDAVAEFGSVFRISSSCDLYAGVYGSYGFMDILPSIAKKQDFIVPEPNNNFSVNSLLASNFLSEYNQYIDSNHLSWSKVDEKWNRWQAGIKIGIHFRIR